MATHHVEAAGSMEVRCLFCKDALVSYETGSVCVRKAKHTKEAEKKAKVRRSNSSPSDLTYLLESIC